MDNVKNLRWLGDHLNKHAKSEGIGQGSEGARYAWAGATEIERLRAENAALKEQVTFHKQATNNLKERYNLVSTATEVSFNEIITQQASMIKQMRKALSIAMINGDYLPNERKQLEKFL